MVKKICDMLESDDMELRCAAAKVLGELKPKEAAAATALAKTLDTENRILKRYALEALGEVNAKQAAKHIVPLLGDDAEITALAGNILAGFGKNVVSDLKAAMKDSEGRNRAEIVRLLASIGGATAQSALFDLLLADDFETVKHACDCLRAQFDDLTAKEKQALFGKLQKFIDSAKVKKSPRATVSGLTLLGALREPKAWAVLMPHGAPDRDVQIRRHALMGLAQLGSDSKLTKTDFQTLVKYLDEPDFPNIVKNTLDVLSRRPLPESSQATLVKLSECRHYSVVAFALRKLGDIESQKAVEVLLGNLDHHDTRIHEAAASSLSRNAAATKSLLEMFESADDHEKMWRLAKILKPHSPNIPKAKATALTKKLLKLMEAGEEARDAYLYVLRNADGEGLTKTLMTKAKKLKSGKKYAEAETLLRPLLRGELGTPEVKYELSSLALKRSPKGLSRQERYSDQCLRYFENLHSAPDFDLAKKLKADSKALDANDYYYLGFHFSEATGPLRELGGELLKHVVKKFPRSAAAKDAKNKIALQGIK